MTSADLTHCLYAATTAAMRAGARIMSYYGTELDLGKGKGTGYEKSDLVTQADRESQEIIESILVDFHPDIGFLAEEGEQNVNRSRFEKPYFWSVDPMDGTKPFINHLNGFAVSIGLVKQSGEPVLGVCYFPVFGDLYHGIVGRGAWHNEHQIQLTKSSDTVKIYLSEAESLSPRNNRIYHAICDSLIATGIKKIKPETIMAPVHKGCLLLDGSEFGLYYGLPRKPLGVSLWDLAAIAALYHACGGYVSDIYGHPLDLNRADSTYIHHNGFIFASHSDIAQTVIDSFHPFKED